MGDVKMNTIKVNIHVLAFYTVFFLILSFAGSTLLAGVTTALDIHDRVGNGWHMYTTATVNTDGTVAGTTTLKNYNNISGFTGGLFLVAVDKDMNPIYSSEVRKWGINSPFFAKCRSKTVTWTEKIPPEYLDDLASIAIVQQHTPTNRVWVWIYDNRDLIIEKAQMLVAFFMKAKNHKLTDQDIWQAVNEVAELLEYTESDIWALEHAGELTTIAKQVYDLAQKEPGSWVPENVDAAKELVDEIIALTESEIDWTDFDEVEQLANRVIALLEQPEGWVPENMVDVQAIIENIYALVKDENISPEVKNIITIVLDRLERMNN
jgi:hypothetical protein